MHIILLQVGECMNIILSLGSLALEHSANFNIVYNIAKQLEKLGHHVVLVGNADNSNREDKVVNNIEFKYLHNCKAERKWLEFVEGNNGKRIEKLIKFSIKHPLHSMFILKSSFFVGALNYRKTLERIIERNDISVIVAFTLPFETAYASIINNCNIKKIYYQLDPYGLYHGDNVNTRKRTSLEMHVIKKANKVITTAALYKEYSKNKHYKKHMDKYVALDFPLIIKKNSINDSSAFQFDSNNINMLFCGKIADEYRNPDFLLNVFKRTLINVPNIKLFFLGDVKSNALDKEMLCQNGHIEIHESVSAQCANATMMSADILVNIGNNLSNMVPSKIFDYFSTGKPILNIAKIYNCPAKEYIEKYPLQFTINEFEMFSAERQRQFEQFALNCKHNSVDFSEVEKIYYKATPKYAAETIINAQ